MQAVRSINRSQILKKITHNITASKLGMVTQTRFKHHNQLNTISTKGEPGWHRSNAPPVKWLAQFKCTISKVADAISNAPHVEWLAQIKCTSCEVAGTTQMQLMWGG